ncbi:MAG TPA: transporter associated domain-containing protein, partial [Candidatus Sericytochromatia bacterium]
DDYQTLGGFLLFQLQKIPQLGESLHYGDADFTIISAEGPRLHQIQIHRLGTAETNLSDFTATEAEDAEHAHTLTSEERPEESDHSLFL